MLLLLRSPFLFGYANPVPVNFRALRRPRVDTILVAAAGPGMNLLLATIAALAFHFLAQRGDDSDFRHGKNRKLGGYVKCRGSVDLRRIIVR